MDQVSKKGIAILCVIILAIAAIVISSVSSHAQVVKIDKIYEGATFSTTSTVYLGSLFEVGQCDSIVVVTENYDSLTAAVKLIFYTPNEIPIDTASAISVYTTATTSIAVCSAALTPQTKRHYVRAMTTANSRSGQTTNATKIRVYLYRFKWQQL